ncbi:hypothetical protein Cgig2_002755 [Carnegiea gigantea]|uniref:Uncharacterized protein n=1 Tax=Carnegiea gigantea TaxID=171969 RepID=A0A9Q1JJW9_9CARY|nr:hypothetical protein Cgig2_002755 [Carnegiea gigantea]
MGWNSLSDVCCVKPSAFASLSPKLNSNQIMIKIEGGSSSIDGTQCLNRIRRVMIMSCYFPPRVVMEITRMLTLLRLCMEGALSDYGMSGAYECLCAYLTKRYRVYLSSTYHCGPAALANGEVAQMRFRRKLSFHVINLAVGAQVELQINYFDSLRDLFLEACGVTAFDIGTNYHGIIDLDVMNPQNGSIFVKLHPFSDVCCEKPSLHQLSDVCCRKPLVFASLSRKLNSDQIMELICSTIVPTSGVHVLLRLHLLLRCSRSLVHLFFGPHVEAMRTSNGPIGNANIARTTSSITFSILLSSHAMFEINIPNRPHLLSDVCYGKPSVLAS